MKHQEILNLPISHSINWKFGLCTRTVYRMSEDYYQIDDTSNGWSYCIISKKQMIDLLNNKINITDLNWEK